MNNTVENLVNKCFQNPATREEDVAIEIKSSIMVSYPDIDTPVDESALYTSANILSTAVNGRILSILSSSMPGENMTDEDMFNYMNVAARMTDIRKCATRIANFIISYNDWKYAY